MTARCRSAQGSGATKSPRLRAVTRTSLKAARDQGLFWHTAHCSTETPGPRSRRPGSVCVGKSVKRPGKKHHGQWGSPQAVSKLCDSVCSLKCIHLRKRTLSSSLSQYNSARPASERYGATTHTGNSRATLAGDSNGQATKAAMSITEHVENYSKNLWLLCMRAGVRPSTTLSQWRGAVSNIALKCTDPKTRAMLIAPKRSGRTSPSKQARVQFSSRYFEVLKRDGGLCPILHLRPINRTLCKRPFGTILL